MDDQRTNREDGGGLIATPRLAASAGMLLLGLMCFGGIFLFGPLALVAGGALIGAALFHLLRLWIWGLLIGAFLMVALLLFLLSQPHIVG